MCIGTGKQIIQRQLKGWAGRKNRFKIIVADFSSVSRSRQKFLSGLEKISHIFTPWYHHCAKTFEHTFSATTSFQFVSWQFCIMAVTRAGAIASAAKAVSKSWRMRKGKSQQQEHVNGVNANQRSNKVKYGRPI